MPTGIRMAASLVISFVLSSVIGSILASALGLPAMVCVFLAFVASWFLTTKLLGNVDSTMMKVRLSGWRKDMRRRSEKKPTAADGTPIPMSRGAVIGREEGFEEYDQYLKVDEYGSMPEEELDRYLQVQALRRTFKERIHPMTKDTAFLKHGDYFDTILITRDGVASAIMVHAIFGLNGSDTTYSNGRLISGKVDVDLREIEEQMARRAERLATRNVNTIGVIAIVATPATITSDSSQVTVCALDDLPNVVKAFMPPKGRFAVNDRYTVNYCGNHRD